MGAFIADFGRSEDGLYLYRVNGDKKEIDGYVSHLQELGCEFFEPVELERTWKQYSVLLKIKFPAEVDEAMQRQKAEQDERIRKCNAERDRIRGMKN